MPTPRARFPARWAASGAAALLALALPGTAGAGVAYGDPGWDYVYDGAEASFGVGGFEALDGTWRHDQSDQWDGSAPGELDDPLVDPSGDSPGGAGVQVEDSATYLRLQDTGNPSLWGWSDPSNRRLYFGHDIGAEHPGASSVLSQGITISFRARLASGVLDDVYPDFVDNEPENPSLDQITPWPPGGKGYNVKDDGKGMFTVQENGTSAVGFALALDLDTPDGVGGGLVMNNQPTALLPGSDRGRAATANVFPIDDVDLLDWHEFWITIQDADADGAYEIDVYADGARTPASFVAKSSFGAEFDGEFLAFGLPSESSFGAVDVDFYAYRLGVVTPAPEPSPATMALAAQAALLVLAAARPAKRAAQRGAAERSP
jgi:hypothetical protein